MRLIFPSRPPHGIQPHQPRHELPHSRRAKQLLKVREHPPQLTPLLAVAVQPARETTVLAYDEKLTQVHDGAARPRGADVLDQRLGLLLPDAAEREDAERAEEMVNAHAARLSPVLAVGCERHVAAVEEPLGHDAPRPAREGNVAGLHHLLRSGSRGHEHGWHAAEPEQHDWAVRHGQGPEGTMR